MAPGNASVPVLDIPRLQMREILAGRWRCCWNCDEWRENVQGNGATDPRCSKYSQRPPTEVIIVGCAEWYASGIPFDFA